MKPCSAGIEEVVPVLCAAYASAQQSLTPLFYPKKQNEYLIRPRFFVFWTRSSSSWLDPRSLVLCNHCGRDRRREKKRCPQVPAKVFSITVRDVPAPGSVLGVPTENELEKVFRVSLWNMGCHIDNVCLCVFVVVVVVLSVLVYVGFNDKRSVVHTPYYSY